AVELAAGGGGGGAVDARRAQADRLRVGGVAADALDVALAITAFEFHAPVRSDAGAEAEIAGHAAVGIEVPVARAGRGVDAFRPRVANVSGRIPAVGPGLRTCGGSPRANGCDGGARQKFAFN